MAMMYPWCGVVSGMPMPMGSKDDKGVAVNVVVESK